MNLKLKYLLAKIGLYVPEDSITEMSRKEIDQLNRKRSRHKV